MEETLIYSEPEYDVSYTVRETDLGPMTFIHMEVYYFSPEVLRRMLKQWAIFRTHVPQALFCHADVDDAKWARFISKFGFKYLTDVPCSDGCVRRIFWTGG